MGARESQGDGAAHADPVCPYCGGGVPASVGRIGDVGTRCPSCKGLLDDLSIHATRGHMGEWFVRDEGTPFRPGCSLATLRAMIERGRVTATSVVRGPDTEQFWHRAGHVPRIARLMGVCPECLIAVDANAAECASCGTHLMSMGDALAEHWHGHGHAGSLAAAVSTSKTAAAEIAEAAVKRQMQREVQTWARRAGLSIGIAVFLFLIVIALATKDMWWARATGGASVAPVTAPVMPPAAPVVAPEAAPAASEAPSVESESPKGEETPSPALVPAPVPAPVQAPTASEPAPAHTPGPAVRSGRDPLWEQVGPLVIADTTESLKQAQELLQRIGENAGAERANEREQANALREWIERRLTARELNTLP